jgi:hypothetical protein
MILDASPDARAHAASGPGAMRLYVGSAHLRPPPAEARGTKCPDHGFGNPVDHTRFGEERR